MTTFADGPAETPEFTRYSDVLEWLAHADERGRRASHAIDGDDGVWIVDPLDAPGLDEELDRFGAVAGVAVLANYHARDAGQIADRYDVPVHVPSHFERVTERIEAAPVERFDSALGDSAFAFRHAEPAPGWRETILEYVDLLYAADLLGTGPTYTVDEERIGVYLLRRPFPPRDRFADAEPERIFVGHGRAVTDDANTALADALAGARRRFPRAAIRHGPGQLRALLSAL
ncbi:hypothetical protein L593_09835 [Salinarchaeum sp. Harcht-Bsk1]|uniref:hypothetical protein n=1 Tax=Salinarchaeum sp. Harcht-Bsk1 TaxID=1333523 RepID=UPI00034232E5|nr:hypothetical protein [Salinarchaeum sp. Harcht-Bsk1]AGN01912.1 hypothetical protein L593_09835 [Salinarchaeum sp. Harcht-Bsk1]